MKAAERGLPWRCGDGKGEAQIWQGSTDNDGGMQMTEAVYEARVRLRNPKQNSPFNIINAENGNPHDVPQPDPSSRVIIATWGPKFLLLSEKWIMIIER